MNQRQKTRLNVIETGVKMLDSSLVVGTWGNISARVPDEDLIAITPSGMNYDELVAEDIVLVDLEGNVVDGLRKPSIEVPMHVAIYQNRLDIQAICHTHSVFATAMAAARKPIPGAVEDLVQIVGGDVRVCEYALPGSKELGQNVIKALEGRHAVLLANHGMLGAGRDLNEALKICQVVEKAAQITIFAKVLGGVVELSQEDIDFMRDFYLNAYGQR
ncbi:MAG: class II aldolase/adducin family protein [Zhaonellaceae bacterium]|jgi:L-fuculose-phosphate aldolase|nr:class II aldolase/adducin family protein [Clostridia bacterium]